MNKLKFLISLLFSGSSLFAQTSKQIQIPGTKYSMVPPAGFVASSNFSGFQNNVACASIMVSELPAPVSTINNGLTADALKTKGMTLIEEKSVDFNEGKARILKISQPANGTVYLKQMLVFGDSLKTVMVNGIYPEASQTNEAALLDAMLSTTFDKNQNDNPLDAVNFRIDVSGTEFKLAKYMSGSIIYTKDGKIPTNKPMFIAGGSISKMAILDRRVFSIERLRKLPGGESATVEKINEVEIDKLPGYAILGHNDSDSSTIYQVILFTDTDDYYILIGIAKENKEENLALFKKVSESFRRK
ncbi:hypothetical protein [Dyadobacter sp. CY312]|uniref:hypothetical protein n=1 Tax=Dyadobacter sp. CY312 TaxID=2907303 RepID=UPI001F172B29|nr:hypothetical protein [Dyadobacter sp. CY312]MCE7043622.1 hypothetical protein [Dyadobacter sp. CY312]